MTSRCLLSWINDSCLLFTCWQYFNIEQHTTIDLPLRLVQIWYVRCRGPIEQNSALSRRDLPLTHARVDFADSFMIAETLTRNECQRLGCQIEVMRRRRDPRQYILQLRCHRACALLSLGFAVCNMIPVYARAGAGIDDPFSAPSYCKEAHVFLSGHIRPAKKHRVNMFRVASF